MNSFGKITGLLVGIFFLFFVPMFVLAQKQEIVMESYVLTKTAYLVEHIRSNGYLSKEMYEQYEKQLTLTGYLYEIEMEHQQVSYYMNEESQSYEKQYQNNYEEDILEVLFHGTGRYEMKRGDFFFLKVTSKTRGFGDKMKPYFLLPIQSMPAIQVELGGMVRDEINGL